MMLRLLIHDQPEAPRFLQAADGAPQAEPPSAPPGGRARGPLRYSRACSLHPHHEVSP